MYEPPVASCKKMARTSPTPYSALLSSRYALLLLYLYRPLHDVCQRFSLVYVCLSGNSCRTTPCVAALPPPCSKSRPASLPSTCCSPLPASSRDEGRVRQSHQRENSLKSTAFTTAGSSTSMSADKPLLTLPPTDDPRVICDNQVLSVCNAFGAYHACYGVLTALLRRVVEEPSARLGMESPLPQRACMLHQARCRDHPPSTTSRKEEEAWCRLHGRSAV